jgi:endoglucanase
MVKAIHKNEVVTVSGKPYLAAGDWAANQNIIALNPSYFAPYAYRVFDAVDPGDGWQGLIDSGYLMVAQASSVSFHAEKSAGLPPDWVGLDKYSGQLTALSLPNTPDTTQYGYIAARTYWQVALDLRYIQDGRAQNYMSQANFIAGEVTRQGYPSSVYTHDGKVVVQEPSTVGVAGALGVFINRDANAAGALYQSQIVKPVAHSKEGIYWGNPDDLSTQVWGCLAIGLYANQLPNLWWYIPPGG